MFHQTTRGNDAWLKNPRSVPLRVWSLRERFTPGERIAGEGPGECFIARDAQTGDGAVLRLLRLRQRPDAPSGVRLRQDLRRVALGPHPHIVRVLDFEVREASLALAHPPDASLSLSRTLASRRVALPECLTIAQHVAAALRFAHAHGVAHGALTPACIFITPEGTARVRDFGVIHLTPYLAQPFPADAARRQTYAAPEEQHALAATPAMDSFHLGALLCEMLTGTPPPQGMVGLEMRRDVPANLYHLIARCLTPQPDARPVMTEIMAELHAIDTSLQGKTGSGIVARLLAQRQPTSRLEDTLPRMPRLDATRVLPGAPSRPATSPMPDDNAGGFPAFPPKRDVMARIGTMSPVRRLALVSVLVAGIAILAGISGGIIAVTHAAPPVVSAPPATSTATP